MNKSLQTEKLHLELYNLTRSFTKALVGRYYYQFRGDVNDLASEFFTQFITPKGRKGAVKESLLDKFNPETTSLAYLVKVCVTRKLIDQSRQNPQHYTSIDNMMEENGDCITKAFKLTSEQEEERSSILNDPKYLEKVLEGFRKLPEMERNLYFVSIFDSQSILASILQPTLRYAHMCPIQQITDKTVVLYVPEAQKLINFSLDDGHPRGFFQPFYLTEEELKVLRDYGLYHSQFTRELFIEYLLA